MAWDPFNDYKKNGYLQNIHRLPLGDDLKQLEHEDFAVFLEDALLYLAQCVTPSYDDLLEVHKIVFQGLYPTWAGKDRNELTPHDNVRKGNIVFCEPHNLRKAFGLAMKAPTLGQQLGHLAYTHPFLDGNGRAIFTFFDDHVRRCGYIVQWHQLDTTEFLNALSQQINRPDASALDQVLQPCLTPVPPNYNHKKSALLNIAWSKKKI